MIKKQIFVINKTGIHARPASILVKEASNYKSSVFIENNGNTLNVKSIVSVLSGGISQGTVINLLIEGEDEHQAKEALVRLFETGFVEL